MPDLLGHPLLTVTHGVRSLSRVSVALLCMPYARGGGRMGRDSIIDMEGFELGDPALVCRWRLANRRLPLENRHMRALLARTVNGSRVTTELVAWAKQHIEWTLEQGSAEHPNGTLMLIVDVQGRAAMTVGPYMPLEDVTTRGLARRAGRASDEAYSTGVAPETLWIARNDVLVHDNGEGWRPSGATSLVEQLTQVLGIETREQEGLAEGVLTGSVSYNEAFLVSDEHGVVPASDATGKYGERLASGYEKLLERR